MTTDAEIYIAYLHIDPIIGMDTVQHLDHLICNGKFFFFLGEQGAWIIEKETSSNQPFISLIGGTDTPIIIVLHMIQW